ncbi:PIN-like domain-containing protein [Mycobacterium sp. MS1601]|uniref:PIN-like domain-containing protein n=1 Tax=Mycobacterium sp. MS1601 TaxID=1936029 RepID=UPI00178CFD1F|nr:PIN domain-containing protein [Mycobacterium sp. MS1601]
MQHTFGEWYEPSESTLKHMLEAGTIALDANVLLDLYRTGTNQRTQILSVFERPEVRSRVWIPYQVGLEFQRNRLEVARQHQPQYEKIRLELEKLKTSLNGVVSGIRDAEIQKSIRGVVDEKLTEAAESIASHLNEQEKQHVISYDEIRTGDPLRIRLDGILSSATQIGPKPEASTIEDRKKKAADRYEREVPPGYRDANKSDNGDGDLLVWFEILDHAEKIDRPVLFVTSDVKSDWYRREAGDTLGPRPELRAEFATRSKYPYHQVRLSTFLHLSNKYLDAGVSGETIDSVEALAEDRRVAYRNNRVKNLRRRLNQESTKLRLKNALNRYEPGTSSYASLSAALGMIEGEREFSANLAGHALRLLDKATEESSSNVEIDAIEDTGLISERIRHYRTRLDALDHEEKIALNELAATLDPQQLLDFLKNFAAVRQHSPDLKLRYSDADGFRIMDGTKPVI